MQKGIVMEMTEADLIVMTAEGQFKRIPRMNRVCQVGEEILFSAPAFRLKRPVLSFASAFAAAVIFCIVLFTGMSHYLGGAKPVVAYVALDINPSVELGVDADGNVQEARGLNEDGTKLLQDLDLKGKTLIEATAALMDRVEQEGILSQEEGDIIISSTKAFEEAKVDESALGEIVKETVAQHIEEKHPQAAAAIQVAALVTPPTVREQALANGVSAGKYAIYLNAKNNGNGIDLDELKSSSVHKVAKQLGGLNKLIDPKEPPKKETLSKLLEAEKKGELDRKLSEKRGNGANGGKSSNGSQSGKSGDDKKPVSKPVTGTPTKTDDKSDKNDRDDRDAKNDRNNRDDKDDEDERKNYGNRGTGNQNNPTKPGSAPNKPAVNSNNGRPSGVNKPQEQKTDEDKKKEDEREKEEDKRREEERMKEENRENGDNRKDGRKPTDARKDDVPRQEQKPDGPASSR